MPGYKKQPEIPVAGIGNLSDLLREKVAPSDEHVRRCRSDFIYFLENIIRDPQGKTIRLKPFHREVCRILTTRRRTHIQLPRSHGKALALDTLVPTPDGWTTMGDLKVGDQVFDEAGLPCLVVAVTEVMKKRPCYRITFSDKSSVVADAQHLWKVERRRTGRKQGKRWRLGDDLVSTRKIAETLLVDSPSALRGNSRERNHRVAIAGGLQLSERTLPVDPYILGIWLGDGHSASGRITVGSKDEWIVSEIERRGTFVKRSSTGSITYLLGNGERSHNDRISSVQARLRQLGVLHHKHVPDIYLRASERQRWDLLKGLMDSDGYASKTGQCEFSNCNKKLAEGVFELVCSLGLIAKWNEGRATLYGKDCGPKYRVLFYAYKHHPVFGLVRKQERLMAKPAANLQRNRRIIAVDPIESVPVRCIQVDSLSGMFLVGRSMIPTHNSTITVAYACWVVGNNRDTRVIIASRSASLAEEWMREIDRILRNKDYIAVFGDLVPAPKSGIWTATEKVVAGRSRHATHLTFFAVGIGGQMAGRRADLCLADDVIDQKNAFSDIQRQHASDWFWKELEPVLEPQTGQQIVSATPWGSRDLYSEIISRWGELDDFEFLRVPALVGDGDDVKSIWPERFPLEELLRKRDVAPLEFASQYMCEPIDTTHSFLQEDWLRITTLSQEDISNLVIYFGLDPAWSGTKRADYSAVVVAGVDPRGNRGYILDVVRRQLSPSEFMEVVESMAQRWRPVMINIEDNAAQKFIREMYEQESMLPVHGSKTKGNKTERFKAMSVHFTSGRFVLAGYYNESGDLKPLPELEPLVYEWVTFPTSDHDDILDALEKALELAVYGTDPEERVIELPEGARSRPPVTSALVEGKVCEQCGETPDRVRQYEGYYLCGACMLQILRHRAGENSMRLRGGGFLSGRLGI